MNDTISLIKKSNQHLGFTDNENLNSDNRLEGWTRYEFSRPDYKAIDLSASFS
jgi:hypothetical protein